MWWSKNRVYWCVFSVLEHLCYQFFVCFRAEYSTYLRLSVYCLCLRGYFCTWPSNCIQHAPSLFTSLFSLCVSADRLTLQALCCGRKTSSWDRNQFPGEHIIIMMHIALKSIEGSILLVFVISRCQKWLQNVSKFATTEKIMGFCFGLMITGVYLGKLGATKTY